MEDEKDRRATEDVIEDTLREPSDLLKTYFMKIMRMLLRGLEDKSFIPLLSTFEVDEGHHPRCIETQSKGISNIIEHVQYQYSRNRK